MTIKDVETFLNVPRATVRFYEKAGLISPAREHNGYRDYSDEDVEKLKKVIIFRKIGLSVEEINDLLDGVKSVDEVLDANIVNLQKQMEELKGAINLTRRMKEDVLEIASMDINTYWNTMEEEEEQGNSFFDIAKDIAEVEKSVFLHYFSAMDQNGKTYDSVPKIIRTVLLCLFLTGGISCVMRGNWSINNFFRGSLQIFYIILVEMILTIPLYFLGKKYEWIRKNRNKALFLTAILLAVVVLIIDLALLN